VNRQFLRSPFWVCCLIFVTCVAIYLANESPISSFDSVSNALLPFLWLQKNTLHLDAFRTYWNSGSIPYGLTEAPNGHLSSTYPIGTAIVAFPFYCFYWLGMRGLKWMPPIEIANPDFFPMVQQYEKLTASLMTAFAVVLFYLIIRLKFSGAIAWFSTLIYAFGTSVWSINSQALWQQGSANLVLLGITLGLLKVNRTSGKIQNSLLVAIGFLCGLLPGIRPVHLVYAIAVIIYATVTYQRKVLYLLLGLPSALLSASWNIYYFGLSLKSFLIAGYTELSREGKSFTQSYYQLTAQQFVTGFFGLLISPSRGILIYSPMTVLAVPGIGSLLRRSDKDTQWFLCLTFASLLLFFQYCFFTIWTAAPSYGTRYLTDIMPVLGILTAYGIALGLHTIRRQRLWLGLITVLLIYSTSVQIIGVFGNTFWFGIPYAAPERFWQGRDTEIERHARSLYYRWRSPISKPAQYRQQLAGEMDGLWLIEGNPRKGGLYPLRSQAIGTRLRIPSASPIIVKSAAILTLEAQLQNTGKSPWFGYETGMRQGMTAIAVQFLSPESKPRRQLIYVSGNPRSGERGRAIGTVQAPAMPGEYEMVFELMAIGVRTSPQRLCSVRIQVNPI
jgi:hypothetical protein